MVRVLIFILFSTNVIFANKSNLVSNKSNRITIKNALVTISHSKDDLAKFRKIQVRKVTSKVAREAFENARRDLDIKDGLDYEIEIEIPKFPNQEIDIKVPIDKKYVVKFSAKHFFSIYYEIAESEDGPGTYIPVESVFDVKANMIEGTLPAAAFNIITSKGFVARIKIGIN